MLDTKKYYAQFTSEELDMINEHKEQFYIYLGSSRVLNIVEKLLGKVHPTTIELQKHVTKQFLDRPFLPQDLIEKLLSWVLTNEFDVKMKRGKRGKRVRIDNTFLKWEI